MRHFVRYDITPKVAPKPIWLSLHAKNTYNAMKFPCQTTQNHMHDTAKTIQSILYYFPIHTLYFTASELTT